MWIKATFEKKTKLIDVIQVKGTKFLFRKFEGLN